MRRVLAGAAVSAAAIASTLAAMPVSAVAAGGSAGTTSASAVASTEYVVAYADGASAADARAAIARAGGTVVSENTKVGYASVTSSSASFANQVGAERSLAGAARNRAVGKAPKVVRPSRDQLAALSAAERKAGTTSTAPSAARAGRDLNEPLSDRQWDMRQIGATANGSYRVQQGSRKVMVGIIDTGVDGSHPDIAPNFNRALSRNFTKDIPLVDGPCEEEADKSCDDAADADENGHGTHVASTVGSPINNLGMAGVAPNVTLVNIRAGQDSGYFFLQSTLDAMTYAGDIGVDVVNMSYYTDPWLFNCTDNPADSPAEQREQQAIRTLTQRAINYAISKGVTPISSEGNGATDLGNPTIDETSPDFPPGEERTRTIDNSCITVPTETGGVVSVSSTGISTRKAYYSNYGTEQTDIAAPGGDFYDSPDNKGNVLNLVLAAYPRTLGIASGDIDKDGRPTNEFVVKSCRKDGVCGFYQYLQGTSMASPHAAGVAALIISEYGTMDTGSRGLTMTPATVKGQLYSSAVDHACPSPRNFFYKRIRSDGSVATDNHYCAGPSSDNGFYGHGIVNAFRAVTR